MLYDAEYGSRWEAAAAILFMGIMPLGMLLLLLIDYYRRIH